jgi:beta-xylosidase
LRAERNSIMQRLHGCAVLHAMTGALLGCSGSRLNAPTAGQTASSGGNIGDGAPAAGGNVGSSVAAGDSGASPAGAAAARGMAPVGALGADSGPSQVGGGVGGASAVDAGGARSAGSADSGVSGPWPPSDTFKNPVFWEDLADLDVFRVDDAFYYSASTMHYSPGAPILRSYDLVHWEFIGHSVPKLDFGAKYDLDGGRAYVKGIWASFLRYRARNHTFYWGGCIEFSKTYIFTATSVEGPWTEHPPINNCYYDAGLLVDDDDTMYVSYGNTTINVAQLSADGFTQVKTQQVFTSPSNVGTVEGSRFYKANGSYYILVTHPPDSEYVLKSSGGPFGPYTMQPLVLPVGSPVAGSGHPHQGGLVQLQNGDWYYMAFVDAYPGGRIPVLAPVTWSNGWPSVTLAGGAWGGSYPYPNVPRPTASTKLPTGIDTFADATLGPQWEWNHNPDDTKWSAAGKLTLQTATVTSDLYSARNTLTHRILGPASTATIALDYSHMKDGDAAGLALLRDGSAWVGIKRSGGAYQVAMVSDVTMENANWTTTNMGTEVASQSVSGGTVWLRISADLHPGASSQAHFFYSTDGARFTPIGSAFTMTNAWQFFMGYRFALFNYATQALGGSVSVSSFDLEAP